MSAGIDAKVPVAINDNHIDYNSDTILEEIPWPTSRL